MKQKLRIHLTDGETTRRTDIGNKYIVRYDVSYCNETFATFPGAYNHSVYHVTAFDKLVSDGNGDICPECMASGDVALYLLGRT